MQTLSNGTLWTAPLLKNLKSKLSMLTGRNVLVLGAGDGRLCSYLANHGASVYAVDKRKSALWANKSNLHYFQADNENLPFSDSFFDTVISCSTFQYVNHKKVFNEIFRVSKNNSDVLLHENLPNNPIIFFYRLKRKFDSLFDPNTKRYISSIDKYLTPQLIPKYMLIEDLEYFYFFSSVNQILLKYNHILLINKLAHVISIIDGIILKRCRFLKKYCWFATYNLRIVKQAQF